MPRIVKELQPQLTKEKSDAHAFPCIYDLLVHYGQTAPRRKAILAPGRAPIRYGALLAQVNEAVRELRRLGIGPRDRVAVVLPNGPDAAVLLIAVAVAAVCVPLNPATTAGELQRYLRYLGKPALLTTEKIGSAVQSAALALGMPILTWSPPPVGPASRLPICGLSAGRADDAFILLTSGATSRPKMVPLAHASVCLSAYNAGAALRLGRRDRLLNVLPLFHAHGLISGLLTAVAAGSSVVCTTGFDATAFFGWLKEFRPTWYTAVPTIHRALLSAGGCRKPVASTLRLVRSASSPLPSDVLGGLEALFAVPVIETYGMTEAASQIAANPLARRKPNSVGRATGTEIAIMNGQGRPLPAGKRGEIYLRGPTITRGYCNDVPANKDAFRKGWFRTGDLGYLDRDGYLFVVGRLKDIINRGGQKIAPAEVEEVFLSHPDVLEAAAFSVPHLRLGEDVAAAVVLRPGARASIRALLSFAQKHLTTYKVPGLVRIVEQIPKGRGGKVARNGLPAALSITMPGPRGKRGRKILAPRSELERELAELWAEVLEIDQLSINDDVFAHGADSLAATQIRARLRVRFGVDCSLKDIFEAPTVAALAVRLRSLKKEAVFAPNLRGGAALGTPRPLSLHQHRFYLLHKLDRVGYDNQVMAAVRLIGPLNTDILEGSITKICERHEVLRSNFFERSGVPMQKVGAACPRLEHLDFSPCRMRGRAAAIQAQAMTLLRKHFDLENELPFCAQLLRFDKEDHALVVKLHHLVTDGWSQQIFWSELETIYAAMSDGRAAALLESPTQYRHFVAWQRTWLVTPAADEQRSYWRAQLEGLTELPLRTDRHRPEIATGRGARYPFKLSQQLSHDLESLGRTNSTTLYMTLLAAFQCLLYRYTQHEDVIVGSLVANRTHLATEPLIGMFANAVALRTNLTGDPRFTDVLQRVRQVTLEADRNQELPVEEVLRIIAAPRTEGKNTLFRVMFLFTQLSKTPALPGVSAEVVDIDPGIARADLLLELSESGEQLHGWLEYSSDLYDAATISRMAEHFRTLLQSVVANPRQRISRLSLLSARERRQLLVDWNGGDTTLARLDTPYQRLARQVKRTPEAIAASAGDIRVSYRELASRVSAISHRLVLEGVGQDVLVILLAERGPDLLAAMLAVQRAGGAFLPLDPTIPPERLAQILQHSRAPVVLTGRTRSVALEAVTAMGLRAGPKVLALDDLCHAKTANVSPRFRPSPSNLAYVICTSGSTGVPKGAMVEQRGLSNQLVSLVSDLQLSKSDVIAHTSPASFVISVWQFLTAIMVGARVHICSDEAIRDPTLLVQEVERQGVTVLQIVPSMLRAILDRSRSRSLRGSLNQLRWLISTGEALPPDLCRDWLQCYPHVPVVNAYGSTECSDDVTRHQIRSAPLSLSTVPIGRPIANTRVYVLDGHLQPVPIGVVGELYVGGVVVGRGYLNDPEQTRRRFLRDPFTRHRSARLYRTGDLVRWRTDRTLEFFGRADEQVKIRGHRVELKEIEHTLTECADIQAAAVLPRHDLGEARLIAYIVPAPERQPAVETIRDFLKTKLPGYMIPSGFVFLKRMPLTAHGKVDRRALAATNMEPKTAGSAVVASRTPIEKILAGIWADLLKTDVGVSDNFFDLGGHSLLAGQVLVRIAAAFGVSLPIRTIFESPTVEALARHIQQAGAPRTDPALDIVHAPETGNYPPSIAQEHVLRIERELPGLPQFNHPSAYRLRGSLNVAALEESVAKVLRRHDVLRTRFRWVNDRPMVVIDSASEVASPLLIEDLTANATIRSRHAKPLLLKKIELRSEQEAWKTFDVSRAPLFRMRLWRLGQDDHVLVLILHHAMFDGWSARVLLDEVSDVYAALTTGRRQTRVDPAPQFVDFARWQRRWSTTDGATRQLTYWREHLRGLAPLFPSAKNDLGSLVTVPSAHERIHMTHDLVKRLNALSLSQGGTVFMTLLTAFKALLLARAGRNDICIATSMANRSRMGTESMIGPLENTALIRSQIDADCTFSQALTRVRDSVLEAHARQELPFDLLVKHLAEEERMDLRSLLQVSFVLRSAFPSGLKLPHVVVGPFGNAYKDGQPAFPIDHTWLAVTLQEIPSGMTGSFRYKRALFKPGAVRQWVKHYLIILTAAASNPNVPMTQLLNRLRR